MRIYLLGFMAAGKSTLGPVIAERGDLRFIDLDAVITELAGRSIPAIFEAEGERGFRDREHSALLEVAAETDLVCATGGGIIERGDNHPLLSDGHVVYLQWDWSALWPRLSRPRGDRPLVAEGERRLRSRWNSRDKIYRSLADQELRMREAGRGLERWELLCELADEILVAAGLR